eukprot:COSAG01_NODE_11366_length_1951_cov_2.083153_2_plen_159_part_00
MNPHADYTRNFTLFEAGDIPAIHDNWARPGGYLPGPGVQPSRRFYELLFAQWGADKGMLTMHEIDFLVFLDYETPSFQADPEGARWFLQGMNEAALAMNVTLQYRLRVMILKYVDQKSGLTGCYLYASDDVESTCLYVGAGTAARPRSTRCRPCASRR